jgi:3-phosphoshikimate 1-carboxyvinyltransferase
MADYRFSAEPGPIEAVVDVPGSKSMTNRALVLAALADGTSLLKNVLLADDTRLMIEALQKFGIPIATDEQGCVAEVTGCRGQIPVEEADVFCGNSGTTMRFCTAMAALGHGGRYRLDGIARMRKRPMRALCDALRGLGSVIECENEEGFPPLVIHSAGLRGGQLYLASPSSSQFVSALLMAAPYAMSDVLIEAAEGVPSAPFLQMTVRMMEQFGVAVLADETRRDDGLSTHRFVVAAPQRYTGRSFTIEPDATGAMYFLAVPAVIGGRVTVRGLGDHSLQGDVLFVQVLRRMGCEVSHTESGLCVSKPPDRSLMGGEFDLGDMPDCAPTLAVLALFADGPTTIRNVANLRIKESDRIGGLARELRKIGAGVDELPDGLRISPPSRFEPATIDTYDDHRIAMSFALAGLRIPGLTIRDVECTSKTFPGFFEKFDALIRTAR